VHVKVLGKVGGARQENTKAVSSAARYLLQLPKETAMEMSIAAEERLAQVLRAALRAELAALPEREKVHLGELEGAVQRAMRRVGRASLEQVVATVGRGYVGPTRACACGATQETDHYASATWQTVLGKITITRAAYTCATCGAASKPLDTQLGLTADRISPLLRAVVSLHCACVPFAEAGRLLAKTLGVAVGAKRAQLVSEALGRRLEQAQAQTGGVAACVVPPPRLYLGLDGILYCTTDKDEEGKLAWREAKVGVFYTPRPAGAPGTRRHSHLVVAAPPIDVAESTGHAYVVHMGDWQGFATKIWHEALRQGIDQVRELVLLSDGADWIASLRELVFDGLPVRVTHILDHRHAEEHLWACARACLGPQAATWTPGPLDDLSHGRVDALLAALRALPTPTAEVAKLVATTVEYYDTRRAMLDYPRFRAAGYQIGSGLAESACKRLVAQRAKGPGMHWTVSGAQAIGTLRATYLSERWEEAEDLAAVA
jgi:hypothetical protein